MIIGNIDAFGVNKISGWVGDDTDLEKTFTVRVSVNGSPYDVSANQFRSDIEETFGPGFGCKGFDIDPTQILASGVNTVAISVVGETNIFKEHFRTFLIPGSFERVRREILFIPEASAFGEDLSRRIPLSDQEGRDALGKVLSDTKLLVLLFGNRTGSNVVTEMLESAGIGTGAFNEPLLPDIVVRESNLLGLSSVAAYLADVISKNKRNNACFLKISAPALLYFASNDLVDLLFPKSIFVVTRRADKLAQAISYWLALRRANFRSTIQLLNMDLESICNELKPQDLIEISQMLKYVIKIDGLIEYFKSVWDGPLLEIHYEILCSNMQECYLKLVDFIEKNHGISCNKSEFVPSTYKTLNSINQELKERFKCAVRGEIDIRDQDWNSIRKP